MLNSKKLYPYCSLQDAIGCLISQLEFLRNCEAAVTTCYSYITTTSVISVLLHETEGEARGRV